MQSKEMDVLERITKLREERHWTEYQLAERSGLTQSTISSWYRKNMQPTLPSLARICDAFGITIARFFMDDTASVIDLRPEQRKLLEAAGKLDAEQMNKLIEFLEML